MNVQDRDRTRAVFDGAADQDLVPEPEDEVEEGAQDGEYERHAHASNAPSSSLRTSSHGKYFAIKNRIINDYNLSENIINTYV